MKYSLNGNKHETHWIQRIRPIFSRPILVTVCNNTCLGCIIETFLGDVSFTPTKHKYFIQKQRT